MPGLLTLHYCLFAGFAPCYFPTFSTG